MTIAPSGKELFRRYGVVLALLGLLTIYGIEAHARRRVMATPATLGDQGAYLAYARGMYETNYSLIGDRNQMPIFPFLLSLLYRPGLTEEQFLRTAQTFNVNLSIALLFLLFLIFRRLFPEIHALALTTATAFGVFLYRAVNAQTEVLFYFVSFCAFALLLRMLISPRWWVAVLGGAVVGLAHLTKASVLPALGLWIAIFVCQTVWDYCRRDGDWRRLRNRVAQLLIVVAMFGAVTFPYLRQSRETHGQYFFHLNLNFILWCDSWEEAREFISKYGGNKWRSLPADQVPSPAKYWREHSGSEIAGRFLRGLGDLARLKAKLIGYYKFVALFIVATAIACLRRGRRARELVRRNPFAAVFCVLFFVTYLLLYAWYCAIVKDTRFILSIFLPFVFTASLFLATVTSDWSILIGQRRFAFFSLSSAALLGLAVIDVIYNGARGVS